MAENHLAAANTFLKSFTENFGEAVDLNDQDAKSYLNEKIVKAELPSDTFYAVYDLKRQAFTFSHGAESFFGISELTMLYFYDQIPEAYREMFMAWGGAAYMAAFDNKEKRTIQPLKQEYRIMVPLRNRIGKYYWVTQIVLPLQLDINRNLISHLNIYRIGIEFENWKNWAIKGEILENNLPRPDFVSKMDQYLQEYLISVFGPKKFEMLRFYAQGNTAEALASKFSISKKTVYTHNKDILAKANRLFYQNFSTVKEAAISLANQGYL